MRILPVVAVALALASLAVAADPAPKPSPAAASADAAMVKYNNAVKAADEAREKALKAPREALIKELTAALTAATKAGDLDTANKIKEKIEDVKAEAPAVNGLAAKFVGRWSGTTSVSADGKLRHDSGRTATWAVQGNKIVLKWSTGLVEIAELVDAVKTTDSKGSPMATWFKDPPKDR